MMQGARVSPPINQVLRGALGSWEGWVSIKNGFNLSDDTAELLYLMQIVSSFLVFAGGYLPCRSPPQAHHLRAIYLQINYAVLLFLLLGFLRMTVQHHLL
jgi:hypothetical protein